MNPDVFHITHINNLPSIIQQGGLWSDAERISRNLVNQNIDYSHIKQRRLKHAVNVANGSFIGHYVPFNFCPRSVMLYVVRNGHENYNGGQTDIIHLVTDVDTVRQNNPFCFFTDIHADLAYAQQIDDFSQLNNRLDWNAINQRYWSDVKEAKQAEFLAFQSVPWLTIKEIGVANQQVAFRVQQLLVNSPNPPLVHVRPQWYY